MEYKDLIIDILKNEVDNIPQEIKNDFICYIENRYNKYLMDISNHSENANNYINLIKFNVNLLLKKSIDDLKSLVKTDDFYKEFQKISNDIFQKALYKKTKDESFSISEVEKNNYIVRINELFSNISFYNQKRASDILSDVLVDLDYLGGGKATSLRVNRNL